MSIIDSFSNSVRSYIEMKTKYVHLKIKDEIKHYTVCVYNPLWLEVKLL